MKYCAHAINIADVRAAAPVTADDSAAYRMTPKGLIVSRELSEAEFDKLGVRIRQIANATNWAVGDWIVYGQALGMAGAKYTRAQELTGMTFDVLSQAARVSSAYDYADRVEGASWTHHRSAVSLPVGERVAVLRRAKTEHWTAAMLQAFIGERQRAMSVGLPLSQIASPVADAPHRKASALAWRKASARRRRIRICPKCGHRWEIQTTNQQGEA